MCIRDSHESVQDRYNIDDFDILAYSADGTYLINRRMPLDNPTLNYPGVELYLSLIHI